MNDNDMLLNDFVFDAGATNYSPKLRVFEWVNNWSTFH